MGFVIQSGHPPFPLRPIHIKSLHILKYMVAFTGLFCFISLSSFLHTLPLFPHPVTQTKVNKESVVNIVVGGRDHYHDAFGLISQCVLLKCH